MPLSTPIAPGAHIELRDAVWRVERLDWTSSGTQAWRCVGIPNVFAVNGHLCWELPNGEITLEDPDAEDRSD